MKNYLTPRENLPTTPEVIKLHLSKITLDMLRHNNNNVYFSGMFFN